MSSLIKTVNRLVAALFTTPRIPTDPDTMSLHDWADLPAYHPVSVQSAVLRPHSGR